MKNKKQRKIMLYLMVILGVTIGFALLSTTLFINGTASIKSNTWNIHWDDTSVNVTTGSVTATTAPNVTTSTSTKDTVSFDVEFEMPGDFYEFEIDAINEGSVDGELQLNQNWITYKSNNVATTLPSYMDFKVTYDDGTTVPATGNVLEHGQSQTYKIRVEFKSNVEELPSNPQPITIEVSLPYVQHKGSNSPIVLPTGKTKDTLEVGDTIKIQDEEFNFLHYEGTNNEDIVMLAKYNLKVGSIYEPTNNWAKIGEYTSNDPGYGLQSSETKGFVLGDLTANGTVSFSTNNYWYSGSALKPEYGTSYPADVYDETNYKGVPGENNYSVAYYIDEYKTILTGYGATIKKARLITYDEVTDSSIGCSASRCSGSCPTNGFITNTTFWLGSAGQSSSVWGIGTDGDIACNLYSGNTSVGIRPVIVISKSTIN